MTYFVTKSPDAESVKDTLTVIDKYNIKTIISLDHTDDSNEQVKHTIYNCYFALKSKFYLICMSMSRIRYSHM